MFVAQIDFSHPEHPADFDTDWAHRLLSSWLGNGQLLDYGALADIETGLRTTCSIPARDSLDGVHANEYVCRRFAALSAEGIQVHTTVVGPDPDHDPPCDCETPQDSVLFTHFLSIESPLQCLTCFGKVPLYRIPRNEPEEYHCIRSWQKGYKACDTLNMGCGVGERFGEHQMSRIDSTLTREGRALCTQIEERLGVRVYYYLERPRGRSLASEKRRKCNGCNGPWQLEEPLRNLFAFRCDPCRLLSNIAFDIAARAAAGR